MMMWCTEKSQCESSGSVSVSAENGQMMGMSCLSVFVPGRYDVDRVLDEARCHADLYGERRYS
jgi:hypothetical protein